MGQLVLGILGTAGWLFTQCLENLRTFWYSP